MILRSTSQLVLQSALYYASNHSSRLADLQLQIATGKSLQRPSDAPDRFRSVIQQEFSLEQFDAYLHNISLAKSQMNVSVEHLLAAKDVFIEARDLAFESRQTLDRSVLATQVDRLLTRLESLANETFDGTYLFSGTATRTRPFEIHSSSGTLATTYQGADQAREVSIGRQMTVLVSLSGREVFQPKSRGATVFLGNTGATAGNGTNSGTSFGELLVRHVATTYAGASGIAPGTGSAGGDTILGPAGSHTITIDDVAKTISLNGGPAVTYTGTEDNLLVPGPSGDQVYVNVQGIVAGFQGSVSASATGSLSIDRGQTSIPIDYSASQAVRHGANGEVLFVNSTEIRRAGITHVEHGGTADAFQVLDELRRDLRNERNLTESQWQEAITRRIEDLDRIKDHFLAVVGRQSSALANMETWQTHHEDLKLETQRLLADLQSANLPAAVAELQSRQTLLQTTYAASLSILNSSLVNFLR